MDKVELPQKRRWLQFSLRTLLIVMLVVAAYFGGRMPVLRELEATKQRMVDAEKRAADATQQALLDRELAEIQRAVAENHRAVAEAKLQVMKAALEQQR